MKGIFKVTFDVIGVIILWALLRAPELEMNPAS